MSDFLYDKGRQAFLEGNIAILTDTIKMMLVTSAYTASQSADQFVSDIPGGDIVVRSAALSGKTSTSGVFNASNNTISSVTGSAASQIIFYKDTGTDSTSKLLAHVDSYTGLPVTPNGGNITVNFPTDANKIWKL
jgi:hypothetical protein